MYCCKDCGIEIQYRKGGNRRCQECFRKFGRAYYRRIRTAAGFAEGKYVAAAKTNAQIPEFVALSSKERARLYCRLANTGIKVPEFFRLLRIQEGKCAICGDQKGMRLKIDHCHKSQRVRGLLCTKCNTGLGHFNDDPELLVRAKNYLGHTI